jgi:hypothetical protein
VVTRSHAEDAGRGQSFHRTPVVLRALLIPADPARPVGTISVADTAVAFSHALGDVLLDTITAEDAGHRYAIYLPDDPSGQPDNPRAAVLAARLGLHGRDVQGRLRGDVLVTGLHPDRDDDQDVPPPVLDAVRRGHLSGVFPAVPAPVGNYAVGVTTTVETTLSCRH